MSVYRRGWTFIPCITPSDARSKAAKAIMDGECSHVKLGVLGSTYGYWRR